ncbi:hypothetical protein [Paraliomyxa miuraensis]|uniref:hypothetical protein n=1 Tax=Paraliomyxa miuraensis TaxID=376150 RepID=UPI0022530071|nr:hypothetical protein [Paraliomyxa miuraensis]MCX4246721.1 hypothetical protein [Paraliomyxa miuraensis]
MKRRGTERVLTFAVTGALLGGVGVGCSRSHGPTVNPGPEPVGEPVGEPAGEPVGEPDGDEGETPTDDVEGTETVNEGPVEQPEGPIVNTRPTK